MILRGFYVTVIPEMIKSCKKN